MATQKEYTVAANACLAILTAEENADVPGWAKGLIPIDMGPKLAGKQAKATVDALYAYWAANNWTSPGPPPGTPKP